MGQDMYLHQLALCTEERLTMCDHIEQSPLCYAALEYIHSLSGAREKKRGKRREKEGGELRSPARDPAPCGVDRKQDVPERMLFRPGSKPVSVIQSTPR